MLSCEARQHGLSVRIIMATPKSTLWPLEPHTKAKHKILERYLDRWFRILGKSQNSVIQYIDGFAGPGEYSKGEMGSPVIALRSAANSSIPESKRVNFHFIESDPKRNAHLKSVLDRPTTRLSVLDNFSIQTYQNEFATQMSGDLDTVETAGKTIAPAFVFIDPFGFSGVPMSVVRRLLGNSSTEVFINFSIQSVNRFLKHPDDKIRANFVDQFGTPDVLKLASVGDSRKQDLRMLFQSQLSKSAVYVRFFSMYDVDGQPIYDLFFASNNRKGHAKMKEAMWEVDTEGAFRFSDATDPSQIVFLRVDPTADLLGLLLKRYSGQSRVEIQALREYVDDKTGFLEKHANQALRLGQDQGKLVVFPEPKAGKIVTKFAMGRHWVDFTRGAKQSTLF